MKMKKLNNKGTTIVELIVSLALISVVLIFMFRLLIDVNNEQTNNDFAIDNQIVRAEIIKNIESEMTSKVLKNISSSGSTASNLIIKFTFGDGTSSTLSATDSSLTYTNTLAQTKRWTMDNCTLYPNSAKVSLTKDGNIYAINIDIEIHTTNDLNNHAKNNTIDDITLSYIGYTSDYSPSITCLGEECE